VRARSDDLSRADVIHHHGWITLRADAGVAVSVAKADRTISAARVTAVFALPVGVAAGSGFRVSYPSLKYKKFKAYTVLFKH